MAIVAIGILAAAIRFTHLGQPTAHVFDEAYYPKAGCLFVGYSRAACDVTSADERHWADRYNDVGSWVHPPLGKWAIGLGQLALGTDAFGWRVAAAVAGTMSVVFTAMIAQLLFRSVAWTWTAGLLVATEHLNVVQSRTGMLDIFLTMWVVLGFLLLLLDRRWIRRLEPVRQPPRPEPAQQAGAAEGGTATMVIVEQEEQDEVVVPAPVLRPWRLAAGVAFGAALATKWSAVTAILGAVILSLAWERTRRRAHGVRRPLLRAIVRESFGTALAFLVVPAVVYVASWTGHFVWFGFDVAEWARMHGAMASYHARLETVKANGEPIHPYLSRAWQWILMARPVVYFYREDAGLRREIIGMGNPVIFWLSVVALPYLAVAWRRSRDWVAGFILIAILAQYLPWFAVPRPQFLFYMAPVTPFLVLAVVFLLRRLVGVRIEPGEGDEATRPARPWLPVAVAVVALSVVTFAWFWPVLSAGTLSVDDWQLRIWFDGGLWSAFNWV